MSEETFNLEEDLGFVEEPQELVEGSLEVPRDFLDPAEYDLSTQEADPDLVENPLLYEAIEEDVTVTEPLLESAAVVLDFTGAVSVRPIEDRQVVGGQETREEVLVGEVIEAEAPTPGAAQGLPAETPYDPQSPEYKPFSLPPEYYDAMEQLDNLKHVTEFSLELGSSAAAEVSVARADAAAAHELASEATISAQDAHNTAVDAQEAADTATQAAGNAQAVAEAAAQDAADAAGIAGAKADVLIQSGAPAAAMQKDTTLWIDTKDGANTPKRWDGSKWVVVTDKAATDAATAAANAQTTADNAATAAANAKTAADNAQAAAEAAQTAASNAQTTATNALTSANGRNSRVTSTDNPSGTTNPETGLPWVDGDTWWRWDNTTDKNVIGEWVRRNGKWEAEKIGHETISSVDVNTLLVTGSARMEQAVVGKIVGDAGHFGLLTAERLAIVPTTNLWPNQRFNPDGAQLEGNITPTVSTLTPPTGGNAVVVESRDHFGPERVAFPIQPGESYAVECVGKRTAGSLGLRGGLRYLGPDVDGIAWFAGVGDFSLVEDLGDGWGRYRRIVDVYTVGGVSREKATVFLQINQQSGSYSTVWHVADVTVRRRTGGVLIEDGAVTADKVAADLAMANKFSGLMATFGEAFIGKVKADYVGSGTFSGKLFNGGTFTGSTFRTAASGQRVQMDSNGLRAYNSSGSTTFSLTGASGSITGFTITGTTITGGTIRTAETGARIQMTSGLLQIVNSGGREIIKIAPDWQPPGSVPKQPALVFEANVAGSPARMAMYGGDIWFMNGGYVIGSLRNNPGLGMFLENTDSGTDTYIRNTGTTGNINIDAGSGGIYLSSNWHDFNIPGAASGYRSWAIRPISIGGVNRAMLQFSGGGANMPQTTIAANVLIDSNGYFYRTTSARRFKNDIRDIGVDPHRVLDVPVRDWVDATIATDDDSYRTRTPGVVAEEVEDVGLEQFVTYDEDGQTSGVLYDRLPLLLIPVVRDLRDRITRLEEQHG